MSNKAAGDSIPLTPPFTIPFSKSHELNTDLALHDTGSRSLIIYSKDHSTNNAPPCLPGQPGIRLEQSGGVQAHLQRELLTPNLNALAPHLWLVATPSSEHVTPLHGQQLRCRRVVITENPELHLTWIGDRIFLKPLPPYLLSHAFWQWCFADEARSGPVEEWEERRRLRGAALGFMRTYHHLLKHESDFRMAKEAHLVPAETDWAKYVAFIAGFGDVPDEAVSPRYRFGELRLGRLNFWAKVFLHQWTFHKVYWQYDAYFAQFYPPLLFVFAVFTIVLSALQVGLAIKTPWPAVQSVASWFPVLSLLAVAAIGGFLCGLLTFTMLREFVYALGHRLRRSRTSTTTV